MIKTVGSVCSGIEAASVAWQPLGLSFSWFSEIAPFPSRVLKHHYPDTPNLGDMNNIPQMILEKQVPAPDMICGGTPCQAFSLAGWKSGLNDYRGNLTLKFVDIVNACDSVRTHQGQEPTIVMWENVEGVLTDKTNAFGCFISLLAGLDDVITERRWPLAGFIEGVTRNVAWRVIDAKYFGLPQQRRRIYVLAGGKNFHPEKVLFEEHRTEPTDYPDYRLTFEKDGHRFEVFRAYSDCLYSSYGTKWNGNAAAYNGSLFVVQDGRLRRLSPLECERLMGFPDGYTDIEGAKKTNRYQATGNSWAVPVIQWLGKRILTGGDEAISFDCNSNYLQSIVAQKSDATYYCMDSSPIQISETATINCAAYPEKTVYASMENVISVNTDESIFISPVGCQGIVRRTQERSININTRLKDVLTSIASTMSADEIERKSRIQHRGRFST